MSPSNVAILIIDRDGRYSAGLARVLSAEGYRVHVATTERAVRDLASRERFNIVVKSFDTQRSNGLVLMKSLRALSPDTQFILVSEGGTIRTAIDAIHHGAFDYLAWPTENEHILRSVRQALDHQALVAVDPTIRERLRKSSDVDIFVGRSKAMHEVQRMIDQVAPTDVTVLIQGESGTGKELAARAIHQKSRRKSGPFVAVNCAALPETLIESEFFGHVRGAFTGAISEKPGRFELARDGTLFLDEIGDLPRLGQADLLRVLEDGYFRPIGSKSVVRANARIVAAANKELEAECAQGAFREDLLYRLNVITIHLPPLRDRPEDIPPLAEMLCGHFAARHSRQAKQFSPQAMRALQTFAWPGNVRQLRNIIERLVLTAPAPVIQPAHLPPFLTGKAAPGRALTLAGMTLAQLEAELIAQTLAKSSGNRTEAARLLGISRRALQYKLKSPAPSSR
jgi:DNA-binding NtrC family response regulator